jgi:hypothetical protein
MMVRRSICHMAVQGKTAMQTLAKLRICAKSFVPEDLAVSSLHTIERVRARWARTGGEEPRGRRWCARNWTGAGDQPGQEGCMQGAPEWLATVPASPPPEAALFH